MLGTNKNDAKISKLLRLETRIQRLLFAASRWVSKRHTRYIENFLQDQRLSKWSPVFWRHLLNPQLQVRDEHKFLSVIVDKLSFVPQINCTERKCLKLSNLLKALANG